MGGIKALWHKYNWAAWFSELVNRYKKATVQTREGKGYEMIRGKKNEQNPKQSLTS